ncbi:hypothetical protein E2I00_011839 [Balaenoptera physalus]|uniref:Taste receptor type 2 n=1 Tax=Balaenoptera physalus TaxID=9770 RepID=A0A643CG40_BALPH|nr:hypothetical protein E2I00_011839 [Balaenoptera physalus]
MLTLLLNIFSILVMTEFVLGNFANGFIALVNCIDWVKRQKVSSADGILTALAVSRIGLLWVILLNWYLIMFNPVLHSLKVRIIVYVAWTVSNHYSIWLATSLSIFYLFKITNFSSLIFLHLKWRVRSVVLMLICGGSINEAIQTNEHERNITQKTKLRDILHLSNLTLHANKPHTLYYVPDNFSAANLFPVETSPEDAVQWQRIPRSQHQGPYKSHANCHLHSFAICHLLPGSNRISLES